jgi:hypothetical protein
MEPWIQKTMYFYTAASEEILIWCGLLVNNRIKKSIIGFIAINHRLCTLRIAGRFFNYSIINVHAPAEDADDGKKDAFYEAHTKAYKECPRHDIKIVSRDMNAQVGRDSIREPNIGRYGLHDTNDNGSRLVAFALAHNLVIGGHCLYINRSIGEPGRSPMQMPSTRQIIY